MFVIKLFIKLNSVTYALKAREILSKRRIRSEIIKNPKPKKGEGCGYILKVENAGRDVLTILENNRIEIKEVEWR